MANPSRVKANPMEAPLTRIGIVVTITVLLFGSSFAGVVTAQAAPTGGPGSVGSVHVGQGNVPGDHGSAVTTATPPNSTTPSEVCIVYFYAENCPHCEDVEEYLAERNVTHDLRVVRYRVDRNPNRFREYLRAYNVSEEYWGSTPTVFVDEYSAVGTRPITTLVDEVLAANTTVPCPSVEETDPADSPPGSASVRTLVTVTTLAAGDAFNPCAIAVLLILLTTVLTRNPNDQRGALVSGLAFTLAVMVTYLLLGTLLIGGLKSVVRVTAIDLPLLREAFGAIAILLGTLYVSDWVFSEAVPFSPAVPDSWRPTMQRYLTGPLWERSNLALGAFLSGIAVSLFLLPCTSGPYFVAGGLLASMPWVEAFALLVLYNAVFVLPMLGVTIAVSGGLATVEDIASWRERNVARLHLLAGTVLISLGVLVVSGIV